ncbi:unnamed protein product, partial [marine sediment metagenome]
DKPSEIFKRRCEDEKNHWKIHQEIRERGRTDVSEANRRVR